jgi:hypothetical protein
MESRERAGVTGRGVLATVMAIRMSSLLLRCGNKGDQSRESVLHTATGAVYSKSRVYTCKVHVYLAYVMLEN